MVQMKQGTGRVLVTFVFGMAACLVATGAQASAEFPAKVKEALKLSCTPQCTLCHSTNPGTGASFGTKFGTAAFTIGKLTSEDADVASGLEAMRAEGTKLDVDGDGKNDIDQIQDDNTNPNQNGEAICGPTYGCGAHVEPQSSFSWGTLAAGGFVAGVGLLRVRSRRKVPESGLAGPRA